MRHATGIAFADIDAARADRAKENVRLYKQGVRTFRIKSARGEKIYLTAIDIKRGSAVGISKRRADRPVALCDLVFVALVP
jgi:hypothetical protein